MNVEIITIGDEILIGQIVDTNSAWIAKELNKNGFSVKRILSIADEAEQIKKTVADALSEADAVIVTGGLGATNDDITKKTLCEFFGTKLVFDQNIYEKLEKYLAASNLVMNELNRSQAFVPEDATIIENEVGLAQNMCFERDGKLLFSLPGVPSEMQNAVPKVLKILKEKFGEKTHLQRHFLVYGIPESQLALRLKTWEDALPAVFRLAYLPSFGLVRLRLSAEECTNETLALMDEASGELRSILGQAILAEEDVPLEVLVGRMLKARQKTLAVAESCTGGNIARRITSVPGSSAYFKGGVVAYSNEVKEEMLNVSAFDIDSYGVVSVPVVEQMAQGVLELLDVDVAVATSGIAGPATAGDEKAVGTVCIAVATRESVKAQQFAFGKQRERNIERATIAALVMIKEALA